MSDSYTIVFKNNSTNPGNVCVFQQDPNMTNPNVMSLAWFTQFCYPNTTIQYKWDIAYSFAWGQTGIIVPGVVFVAGQTLPANLSSSNQVTLTYKQAYNFINQGQGGQTGSLYITEDETIPLKQAAVGIGMSGAGTFVQQAQPNLTLTFTPHPTYWIAFGNYMTGQVLNIQSMTNPQEVVFPPGVKVMSAVLNPDNTWTVMPISQANHAFVARNYPNLIGQSDQRGGGKWDDAQEAPKFMPVPSDSNPTWP
jgi:hypothetical protein